MMKQKLHAFLCITTLILVSISGISLAVPNSSDATFDWNEGQQGSIAQLSLAAGKTFELHIATSDKNEDNLVCIITGPNYWTIRHPLPKGSECVIKRDVPFKGSYSISIEPENSFHDFWKCFSYHHPLNATVTIKNAALIKQPQPVPTYKTTSQSSESVD